MAAGRRRTTWNAPSNAQAVIIEQGGKSGDQQTSRRSKTRSSQARRRRSATRTTGCAAKTSDARAARSRTWPQIAVRASIGDPGRDRTERDRRCWYMTPRASTHETGEVLEHDNEDVQRLTNTVRYLETELDAAQDEITKLLVEIKSLKTRNANADVRAARREEIHEAFQAWQEICNKTPVQTQGTREALQSDQRRARERVHGRTDPRRVPRRDAQQPVGRRRTSAARCSRSGRSAAKTSGSRSSMTPAATGSPRTATTRPRKFSGPGANLAKVAVGVPEGQPDVHCAPRRPARDRAVPRLRAGADGHGRVPESDRGVPVGVRRGVDQGRLRVKQGQRRRTPMIALIAGMLALAPAPQAPTARAIRAHPRRRRVRPPQSPNPPTPADAVGTLRPRVRHALHPVRRPPLERQREHAATQGVVRKPHEPASLEPVRRLRACSSSCLQRGRRHRTAACRCGRRGGTRSGAAWMHRVGRGNEWVCQ